MDFLTTVKNLLDMASSEKSDVMRELTAHFDELYDEFVASGMGAAQAQTEAETRMGSPADIAARLNAAHNTASWKSALLCVAPFVASAVYLAASALGLASGLLLAMLITIGVVMLSASARELMLGRRPLWLATWLAAGLLCAVGVFFTISGPLQVFEGKRVASVSVLLLAFLTLIAGIVTRQMLKTVVIVCTIAASSAFWLLLTMSGVPVMMTLVCTVVLLVLLAKLIFQAHTYGSALQATLFLLATFTLRFVDSAGVSHAWSHVVTAVLCAFAVIWFTRAPRRGTKALACYIALFVPALAGQLPFTFQPNHQIPFSLALAIFSAALWAGMSYLIVVLPTYPVIRSEVDRLRIAR